MTDTLPLFAEADLDNPPDPMAPDENAPHGYMVDPVTGERRPKIRPGRQSKKRVTAPSGTTPSLDDLKTTTITRDEDRSPDRPPAQPRGKRRKTSRTSIPVPPFRAGPIATGMNKLYLRAGKLVRVMDHDIGTALISVTRKESEDDTTVGDAWEEMARTNPRIRAFLLKMISGSAWSGLFMAHAPIFLAILMKENIRKRLPFTKFVGAFLDDEPDGTPSDVSEMLGGLQGMDVQQMMDMAQQMMQTMPRNPGFAPRTESVIPGLWADDPGFTTEQPQDGTE